MAAETRFATHRGQRIAYCVSGPAGAPCVVLQHGFFSQKAHYAEYREAFAQAGFRAIAADSLGHGESDKPADPAMYVREQRAGDIAAVLDAEGVAKAHYIGYSMGGWIGTGLAKYQPGRLLSLTVGGWSPERPPLSAGFSFATMLEGATKADPEFTNWVRPEHHAGLKGALAALDDTAGSEEALATAARRGVPVQLWAGRQDAPFAGNEAMARKHGWDFLAVEGDHGKARKNNQASVAGLVRFVLRCGGRAAATAAGGTATGSSSKL